MNGQRVVVGGAEGGSLREVLEPAGPELPQLIDDWASVDQLAGRLIAGPWPARGLVLVDAETGISRNTCRDLNLFSRLGVRDLILAIGQSTPARFQELSAACRAVAQAAGASRVVAVPVKGGELASVLGQVVGQAPAPGATAPDPADAFRVAIVWTAEDPLLPGRAYTLLLHGQTVTATVAPLRYRLDLESGEHRAATTLSAGELGVCDIELSAPIVSSAGPGESVAHFELRDRLEGQPMGVGVIEYALRRAENVRWQSVDIGKQERSGLLGQKPTVLWLTGRPGAGKSTIANLVEAELHLRGHHTYLLDGDNVRHGLNADLGFTQADRVENIRRVAEVARLMADAGLIVLVSFISPFRAERMMARSLLEADEFMEVWVDAPLAVAEQRDPKGLYAKARRGELANFTGIDSPYEPPQRPEVHLRTAVITPAEAAGQVVLALERAGRLRPELSPGSGLPR